MNRAVLKRVIADQRQVIKNARIVERDYSFEEKGCYVVTGLRRSGKTMLLYKRVQELVARGISWDRIIYINFEDERLSKVDLSDLDEILSVQAEMSDEKGFFFFDEIQVVSGWESFARRLADYDERVYITGSNARLLSRDIEGRLAGRYLTKRVYTYSFKEYLSAIGVKVPAPAATKQEGIIISAFHDYMTYGGFPATLLFSDRREYVSSVYQKVLLGDMIERHNIRHPSALKALIKKIAESVKDELSYTRLTNLLKSVGYQISKDTVIDYIDYAKDAYLIFPIRSFFASFSDKESTPKYYFSDTGLLSLFLIDKDPLLLENLVATALIQRYSEEEVFFLKSTKTGVDIDFYIPKEEKLIQAAYSLDEISSEREWKSIVKANKTMSIKENLILTYSNETTLDIDGIHIEVMPLWKWLL